MVRGLSADVALITDGRFSGGSHGFVIGHITPEAFLGGPIALIKDGDNIIIDAQEQNHYSRIRSQRTGQAKSLLDKT